MRVTLNRELKGPHATPGRWYLDAKEVAFSLEDTIREVPGLRPSAWKIPGETAIPSGSYLLGWTFSARFKRKTLELMNVPAFTGIRIHGGNDEADTHGCPMAGLERVGTYRIRNCAPAVKIIEDAVVPLLEAGEKVWLDVWNPGTFPGFSVKEVGDGDSHAA